MQHPSPAPRRRRRVQPDIPLETGQYNRPVHRVKSSHVRPSPSFFEQIPTPLRIAIITLCIAVFFTSAVAITRNYLREQ